MGTTAQDGYRRILREHVAPALRELGFRGAPSRGNFRYETSTHAAEVRFRKSSGSTRQQVRFWVLLHATEIESEQAYWDRSLDDLARDWGHSGNWIIHAGNTIEPVAGEVVHSLRSHAWPAIQAALDNPGYPPDRSIRWARTFPKIPRGPRFDDEVAAAQRSRGKAGDLMRRAASDPGALQALLARLETEPDPGIRRDMAWYLIPRACEEEISRALQAANVEDEDIGVRWIARYALLLPGRTENWGCDPA